MDYDSRKFLPQWGGPAARAVNQALQQTRPRRRAAELSRSAAEGFGVLSPAATLERHARGLKSGLLMVPEVASAVLYVLSESTDRAALWAGASAAIREPVLAYLSKVGAANLPPMFWIGPGEPDPARRAAHTTYLRMIAAELLADAEQEVEADPRHIVSG